MLHKSAHRFVRDKNRAMGRIMIGGAGEFQLAAADQGKQVTRLG